MGLLERDDSLLELEQALGDAIRGEGRVILLSGEAGGGKTALVEQFGRARRDTERLLWGACDPLFTPRPLGPLHDMVAGGLDIPAALLQPGNHAAIFAAVLAELRVRPTIAVFEDVHWADEATLDLLRFLGRRIAQTSALLIITYRDDELGPRHPLRIVLGDLSSSAFSRRVALPPLSEPAVRALIGEHGIDPTALHSRTGGNPFFITEVLAGGGGLPPTVRDAILARVARVSPAARTVLQAAAVIGPRIEPAVLAQVAPGELAAVDECLASGVLLAGEELLSFRHELARETILESISPLHRIALHRMTLEALRSFPVTRDNPARLAHHAEAAADPAAVLEFAPAAAKEASAAGSHRAAAALYQLALRYADSLPPAEQAQLLEAYAAECNFIDRRTEGVEVCRKAIAIWREMGNPTREGDVHAQLVSMLIGVGENSEAERHAAEAVAILESQPPGRELAFAYRMQATICYLEHDYSEAIAWAEKAIALSEPLHATAELLSARNIIGSARMFIDFERGCDYLETNMAAAREAGRDMTAAHAYANLGSGSCELYHLRRAEQYLADGIAFSAARDLDRLRLYMTAWEAMTHLRLGRWEEATGAAEAVLRYPGVSIPSRVTALVALGLARARRGEPEAAAILDEALELTRGISNLHRVGLARAARAEAAWLAGDSARAAEEAHAAYDLAIDKRHPWFAGELAFWLWRAGVDFAPPDWAAEPFRAHISGDWAAAAAAWERLRCPYEAARALADGDEAAQRDALLRFERLGARPAADELRDRLRAAGVARIPRGPRPATRENPFGLTSRQVEIVSLLAESLTNAQIAARLQLSPKTVDHHVSAVLAKMDVHTREEAADLARQHALLNPG